MKQVDFIQTSDSGILTKEDHDPIILNKTGVEIYQYYVDNKQITADELYNIFQRKYDLSSEDKTTVINSIDDVVSMIKKYILEP